MIVIKGDRPLFIKMIYYRGLSPLSPVNIFTKPCKFTNHSISSSPYKNGKADIVADVSQACKKFGLKFGIYLSPWDRNSKLYGQGKTYDDYFINQLTELLTNYGPVFSVWFDGACGEGPNGKKGI